MTETKPEFLNDAIVEISDLHFAFADRPPLFSGLNIRIPRGKVTTIMGPSGSGKTTLLQLIGGQLRPKRGNVLVDGENVHELRRAKLFDLRLRMGVMFQKNSLFPDLTVFENVAFPLREHTDLPEELIRSVVLMKLHAVGLRGARELTPNELSGGMLRRVSLARAIVMDPMMIFYDDPFSGQDPVTLGVLMRLIRGLNKGLDLTSVIISHDVEEVSAISDYLYFIHEGKVADQGTPEQLGRSSNAAVDQFVHRLPDGPVAFQYPAHEIIQDLHLTP